MVKQMKKAKITCEVTKIGVCTRAKTMGLKNSSFIRSISLIKDGIKANKGDDGCYLQLRSRRLERRAPPFAKKAKKSKPIGDEKDTGFKTRNVVIEFEKKRDEDNGKVEKEEKEFEREEKNENDEKEEGSFGENVLHIENKERTTRESTPCNFIVNSDIITKTPISSNRATIKRNTIKEVHSTVPIMLRAEELEGLLGKFDKPHIEEFIKKYNFDPANEKPLEGRYEWVKIKL